MHRQDTAYSNEAIGPHTDGTYFEHPPGIQVFIKLFVLDLFFIKQNSKYI